MKNGNQIIKWVLGIIGLTHTLVGVFCLTCAVNMAGDLWHIFSIPGDDVAIAIVGTVFSVLGVVFLAVTLLLLSGARQKRLHEELLQYGTRVTGVITEVRVNRSLQVNGRSPLVAMVQCQFPTGEVTLKSKNLWSVCPATGDTVEVIYDPMDEKRYVMEFPGK